MKLFKIKIRKYEYAEWDAFIIAANNEDDMWDIIGKNYSAWYVENSKDNCTIEEIKLDEITETRILLGSFNAG